MTEKQQSFIKKLISELQDSDLDISIRTEIIDTTDLESVSNFEASKYIKYLLSKKRKCKNNQ